MNTLLDARDLMKKKGRCFTELANEGGQHCMLGALAAVHGISEMDAYMDETDIMFPTAANKAYSADVKLLADVIKEQYPEIKERVRTRHTVDALWNFNDGWTEKGTHFLPSDDEIFAMFEKAAMKKAENEQLA